MSARENVLGQLIDMSRWLGEEGREFAILGEGNTSAKISEDSFFVKASGEQLGNITENGIVEVSFGKALDMLDGLEMSDSEVKTRLSDATINNESKLAPSIETLFHAYLLSLPGVGFVGHTHPVSVNAITCSAAWRELTRGRLFPDEIVCCGIAPAYIDFTDPGVALGRAIRDAVNIYLAEYGERPKSILMQNHGLIAIGNTASEVKSNTAMWDKTAKVLAGTFNFGGPNYMAQESAKRIYTRPDELDRKKLIDQL